MSSNTYGSPEQRRPTSQVTHPASPVLPGSGVPDDRIVRRTTTTTYSSRIPWLPLIGAVVVLPLVLAALAVSSGLGSRDSIESDLAMRSRLALTDSGMSNAQVSVVGRDVTVTGIPAGKEGDATNALADIDGVRAVSVSNEGAPEPAPAAPFDVVADADKITLTGSVPDAATKKALVDAATSAAGGRQVIDRIAAPDGSAPAIDGPGVAALVGALSTPGIGARVDGNGVTLAGAVANDADRLAAEAQIRAGLPGQNVINQLAVVPPAPVAPPPTFDKAALQQRINGLIAAQAITFAADTATLTGDGARTVAQVAEALNAAPDARVEIDGHVAKTPGPSLNARPLSEQRAQAVRARLVDAGIAPDRLSAMGFAAERPIASNDTAAGQAANRRVEIIVL